MFTNAPLMIQPLAAPISQEMLSAITIAVNKVVRFCGRLSLPCLSGGRVQPFVALGQCQCF